MKYRVREDDRSREESRSHERHIVTREEEVAR